MRRILVTGGTGFVGANLVRRLLKRYPEAQIYLFVRGKHTNWRLHDLLDAVRLHELTLDDRDAVLRCVTQIQPEWVFHLAAHGAYSWQTNWYDIVQTNLNGSINLFEACAETGFTAFVNAGSSSEYGFKDHAPSEDEYANPNSNYAATKLAATQYCRQMAQAKNLPMCTLRLYSVFGPYEEPNRFFPALILRGLNGALPPLVEPDIARDYIHVDDVCDAFISAATAGDRICGEVFNVGTGVQTKIKEIVELVRATLAIDEEPYWGSMPNRTWDTNVWVANPDRIKTKLGWTAKHTLEAGFKSTVDWFNKNPHLIDYYRQRLAAGVS